jgi:methylthioribose-1-phosphate isomerase
MIKTIEWTESGVVMLDQTLLPGEEIYHTYTDHEGVADAIRSMIIRGAPAIGVAAAMGVAIGIKIANPATLVDLDSIFERICGDIASTRPTAVNLFWAVERMKGVYHRDRAKGIDAVRASLIREATAMYSEDIEATGPSGDGARN